MNKYAWNHVEWGRTGLGLNPSLRGDRPATNHLKKKMGPINPLNAKLNPICHLLALLGAHPILHVSRIMVKHAVTK